MTFKPQNLTLTLIRPFSSSIEQGPLLFNHKNEHLGHSSFGKNPVNDYLHQLHLPHTTMDSSGFAAVLEQCAHDKALLLGMLIHSHIVECGLHHITYVANFLLQMYSKCEVLAESLALFIMMHHRNGFSWNLIIRAFARAKQSKEALQSFDRMQEEAVLPSKVTYVSALDACANEAMLSLSHHMHTRIVSIELGEETVIWETALVNMYGKCNSLKYASIVFSKMQDRNVVSWTAMISVCEQMGRGKEARLCFRQMQQEGILPNKYTFVSVLASCASDAALTVGRQMHVSLHISGLDKDTVTGSALISMYGKCDSLVHAEVVFDQLITRNIVVWTTMIETYSQHGHGKLAFSLFEQMQQAGLVPNKMTFVGILAACASPDMIDDGKRLHDCIRKQGFEYDVIVGTALINMYAKCGSLKDAEAMFNLLPKWDVVSWNSMIGAYAVLGMVEKALEFLDLMQRENVKPNKVTFVNILVACASHATILHEGQKLHSCILEADLESNTAIANSLINVYGKCASLNDAQQVFDKISERNVLSWSSMICVYANHGLGKRALHLFAQMQEDGIPPDKITFVSVLAACSHAGLLDEAYDFFASMASDYNISPISDHYVCMVDVLGKAGCLNDAETLIKNMPFQPAFVPFSTFLGACRNHVSPEQGEQAASSWLEMDNVNLAPYLMLAYIYTAAGRGGDLARLVGKLRKKFQQKEGES